ncbi:hypothetical protein GCM10010469_51880 [Streptomyces labedae]|uniref:Uncharacterized protein n=1 Tax=Streptomyces labedae TaxID=285569 RepID=A0ABP6R2T6_9ACTN
MQEVRWSRAVELRPRNERALSLDPVRPAFAHELLQGLQDRGARGVEPEREQSLRGQAFTRRQRLGDLDDLLLHSVVLRHPCDGTGHSGAVSDDAHVGGHDPPSGRTRRCFVIARELAVGLVHPGSVWASRERPRDRPGGAG